MYDNLKNDVDADISYARKEIARLKYTIEFLETFVTKLNKLEKDFPYTPSLYAKEIGVDECAKHQNCEDINLAKKIEKSCKEGLATLATLEKEATLKKEDEKEPLFCCYYCGEYFKKGAVMFRGFLKEEYNSMPFELPIEKFCFYIVCCGCCSKFDLYKQKPNPRQFLDDLKIKFKNKPTQEEANPYNPFEGAKPIPPKKIPEYRLYMPQFTNYLKKKFKQKDKEEFGVKDMMFLCDYCGCSFNRDDVCIVRENGTGGKPYDVEIRINCKDCAEKRSHYFPCMLSCSDRFIDSLQIKLG